MNQPAVAAPAWPTVVKGGLACAALLLVSACGPAVAHPSAGRTVLRARMAADVVAWVDQPARPTCHPHRHRRLRPQSTPPPPHGRETHRPPRVIGNRKNCDRVRG